MARLADPTIDTDDITGLLALIPNGPHETLDSVRIAIEESGDILAVDTEACCRMHPRPETNEFFILWWVWKGNDRKAWQRCLLFVLEEALRQYGAEANSWVGSGEFSGAGPPGATRRRNAEQVANAALPSLVQAGGGRVTGTLAVGVALMRVQLQS